MDKPKLDSDIKRPYTHLPFLWDIYNYHLAFFIRDFGMYGKGFAIGLENDIYKLVFWEETNSSIQPIADYVRRKTASFSPPYYSFFTKYGWYSLNGLVYWLSSIEYECHKDAEKDLKTVSQYLKLHLDKVHELFGNPEEIDTKLEYYRTSYKEIQITVDKIRDKRARLHTFGNDSSLEAAIKSLQGGK